MNDRKRPYFGITLSGLELPGERTFATHTAAALELQRQTGFNAVEIWMDGISNAPVNFWPEDYDEHRLAEMAAFLAHFDTFGVHLPFAFSDYTAINPTVARAAADQIALGIDAAVTLGASYCVAHARFRNLGHVSEEENFRRYAEAFRAFAERAAAGGATFCVETCEFLDSPDKFLRMIELTDHPNCKLTLDAGKFMVYASANFGREGAKDKMDWTDGCRNMLAWLDEHADLIGSTHLWDYEKYPGAGSRILPGNGLCDIRGVVARLIAGGYAGSFNLETSGSFEQEKKAILTLKGYIETAERQ